MGRNSRPHCVLAAASKLGAIIAADRTKLPHGTAQPLFYGKGGKGWVEAPSECRPPKGAALWFTLVRKDPLDLIHLGAPKS
eukprot:gene10874-biopygen21350